MHMGRRRKYTRDQELSQWWFHAAPGQISNFKGRGTTRESDVGYSSEVPLEVPTVPFEVLLRLGPTPRATLHLANSCGQHQ